MDIYRENILDHYRNPRNYGKVANPDISQFGDNPLCGDSIEIQLILKGSKISQVYFIGKGCAIFLASASMLCEHIRGMSLVNLRKLSKDDILELIGITLSLTRLKCALLPLVTVHKAVNALGKGG